MPMDLWHISGQSFDMKPYLKSLVQILKFPTLKFAKILSLLYVLEIKPKEIF